MYRPTVGGPPVRIARSTWKTNAGAVVLMALLLLELAPGGGVAHPGPSAISPHKLPIRSLAGPLVTPTAAPLNASPAWGNISASQGSHPPGNEFGRSVAFDPKDGYVLLYGGYTNHTYLNQTWTFSRGHWTELFPTVSPPARDHSALVYDARDGYMLLFGGANSSSSLNDTWTFLGGKWTELHPSAAPSIRWASQMAYDSGDGYVLLFGGCDLVEMNDTWKFSGGNWSQILPAVSPSPRGDAAMQDDVPSGFVVLYGGTGNGAGGAWAAILGDTWTYHGGTWINITFGSSPSPRRECGFAWDAASRSLVLFGGSGDYGLLNETWSFSSGLWQNETGPLAPSPRTFPLLSNDSADGYLVLFGGVGSDPVPFNDTWVFEQVNASASATPNGGSVPLDVQFTSSVIGGFGPVVYNWSLGDGSFAALSGFDHVYRSPGAYPARLLLQDRFGSYERFVLPVYVVGPPAGPLSLSVTGSPNVGVAPMNVSFVASAQQGQRPYSIGYVFGDGSSAAGPNVSHVFERPGNYTVNVTGSDSAGESTRASVLIVVAPVLNVTAQLLNLSGMAPLLLVYSLFPVGGIPPYFIDWNFGDGTTSSNQSGQHPVRAAGNYVVTASVVDSVGEHASFSWAVSVHAGPPSSSTAFGWLSGAPGDLVAFALGGVIVGAIVYGIARGKEGDGTDETIVGAPDSSGPTAEGDESSLTPSKPPAGRTQP
ncbi:MAG: PKD domain-containing protein [Thermoplasmata archaeon]|nr:PKD domain-containing protein [Thermoplasmata archaeon]